jgi:hypothetical protein
MPEVFLVQPSEVNIQNRTIYSTIPADVPTPAFSLFEEVRVAPDAVAVVVGLEFCSLERSLTIFEHPGSEGWWVHLHWKFDTPSKRNWRRAEYLGFSQTEGYLMRLAEEYQQSQATKAAEPELLPIAS